MAAGDFVQVVGKGTVTGTNATAIVVTVGALGGSIKCSAGNTLVAVRASQNGRFANPTNSTGSDTWATDKQDTSAASNGANALQSCQLTADLALGATISCGVSTSTDSGKNVVILEFEGHLTADTTSEGGADSGGSSVTSKTVAGAGATAQASNTIVAGGTIGTAYTAASAAVSGYTNVGQEQTSTGTVKTAAAFYLQITSAATPSAAWTWTGSSPFQGVIVAYQVPAAAVTPVRGIVVPQAIARGAVI
jgi:hypothetical protein